MNNNRQEDGRAVYSVRARIVRGLLSAILILYTCITIFVIITTLLDSFKGKGDLISNFIGLPKEFVLDNYRNVIMNDNFLLFFRNSFILTFCGTIGCIFLSAMAAYGIARYEFRGKNLLTSYFLIGMMVPIQVSVLPLFLILRRIGLLNRLGGMILVYISGISMSCLVFQKFFSTLPKSLEESARMDGCHDMRIFVQIILPISKPVLFTMALITAVQQWNDFYMPMVLLGSKNVTTLTLAIYRYLGQFVRYMGQSMAAVIITLIPIIIIYFLFSSQIVEGLTGGAVKE